LVASHEKNGILRATKNIQLLADNWPDVKYRIHRQLDENMQVIFGCDLHGKFRKIAHPKNEDGKACYIRARIRGSKKI
jgi:hypothetical protein